MTTLFPTLTRQDDFKQLPGRSAERMHANLQTTSITAACFFFDGGEHQHPLSYRNLPVYYISLVPIFSITFTDS